MVFKHGICRLRDFYIQKLRKKTNISKNESETISNIFTFQAKNIIIPVHSENQPDRSFQMR